MNSVTFKINLYFINQQRLHTFENYVAMQKEHLGHVWVLGPHKPHQGPLLLGVCGSPDWEQVVQGINERTGQTFSLQTLPVHTGPLVRWFS